MTNNSTQEQSSKNDSPFLYLRHLHTTVLEIPHLTSKDELDLTPVCLPLTRVQYLFIGTFRTQICRYLNLPFIESWQLVYTNKEHYHHSRMFSDIRYPPANPWDTNTPLLLFLLQLSWRTLELHINGIIEYELLRRYHALSVTFWDSSTLLDVPGVRSLHCWGGQLWWPAPGLLKSFLVKKTFLVLALKVTYSRNPLSPWQTRTVNPTNSTV